MALPLMGQKALQALLNMTPKMHNPSASYRLALERTCSPLYVSLLLHDMCQASSG